MLNNNTALKKKKDAYKIQETVIPFHDTVTRGHEYTNSKVLQPVGLLRLYFCAMSPQNSARRTYSVGLLFGTVLIFYVGIARTTFEEVRHFHHDFRFHDSLQFHLHFQKTGVYEQRSAVFLFNS